MDYKINSPEWFEAIAAALKAKGLDVRTEYSGGGIIILHICNDGILDIWGTANETWGADRYTTQERYENGDPDKGLEISLSTEELDINKIVEGIYSAYA